MENKEQILAAPNVVILYCQPLSMAAPVVSDWFARWQPYYRDV